MTRIFLWVFRSTMLVLTLALCLLLIASGFSDLISPNTWIVPSFLGIAYGGLLLAAILWTVVVAMLRRWHCLLLMVVSLLLTTVPSWRICPLHFGDSAPLTQTDEQEIITQVDTLNILSFNTCIMGQSSNVGDKKKKIPVVEMLRVSGADIAFLQEYSFSLRQGGHSDQSIRQELHSLYPYSDLQLNNRSKAIGIMLFSRYPIKRAVRIDTRQKGYVSAMYYQLQVGQRLLGVVNLHLQSNLLAKEDRLLYDEMVGHFDTDSLQRIRTGMLRSLAGAWRQRAHQADMIVERVRELHPEGTPLIICGDFNDTPVSYVDHTLRGLGLTDTWQEVGFGPGITYHEHRFWYRIDRILHSDALHPLRMRVRRDVTVSDHYPLQATFQLLPE